MPPQVPAGKQWAVTSQTHTVGMDATGAAGPGWQVQFQLANGDTGKTFIPESQYTEDTVRAKVAALADTMLKVSGLSG